MKRERNPQMARGPRLEDKTMESTQQSPFAWLVMLSIVVLASCGGPPVDALQSAEDALDRASLAEECANEEYRAAQRLLEDAEAASTRGDYDRALQLAQAAESWRRLICPN